ncbi:MAG: HU family DNA-binding protein [Paludibacteraceae bacterium]|nr:HU family DNA-binding protein [Paludibacteraceae bacterium]
MKQEHKISWVELRQIVAQNAGVSNKDAATFLQALTDEIIAAMKAGDSVRINHFGTFRAQQVASRRSVNVSTGEQIELPAHFKPVFAPEVAVRTAVSGQRKRKLAEGNVDPIQKLSEQADEIVDILADMGQGPKAEEVVEQPAPQAVEEPQVVEEPQAAEAIVQSSPQVAEPAQPKRKPRLWLTAGLTVVFFLILLIGLVFFFQYKMEEWFDALRAKTEGTELVITEDEPFDIIEEEDTIPVEPTVIEEVKPTKAVKAPVKKAVAKPRNALLQREYTEFIATIRLNEGSRLAWEAYKYYGRKDLWVYIYDANRDRLKHHSKIKTGTTIRIPKLTQEQLEQITPEAQHEVEYLTTIIMEQEP